MTWGILSGFSWSTCNYEDIQLNKIGPILLLNYPQKSLFRKQINLTHLIHNIFPTATCTTRWHQPQSANMQLFLSLNTIWLRHNRDVLSYATSFRINLVDLFSHDIFHCRTRPKYFFPHCPATSESFSTFLLFALWRFLLGKFMNLSAFWNRN